jgi:IS30 family transposase
MAPRSQRGYRAEQACAKASERAQRSNNARRVDPKLRADVDFFTLVFNGAPSRLQARWLSSMRASVCMFMPPKLTVVIYRRTCASQKSRRKRYLCGRDRRGQIPNRRPINEIPSHIEDRKQVGNWEDDTVIGAAHKQVIVTLVDGKSGFAVKAKVLNKSADLVGRAIEAKLKSLNSLVKTLTVDNGKFRDEHLN